MKARPCTVALVSASLLHCAHTTNTNFKCPVFLPKSFSATEKFYDHKVVPERLTSDLDMRRRDTSCQFEVVVPHSKEDESEIPDTDVITEMPVSQSGINSSRSDTVIEMSDLSNCNNVFCPEMRDVVMLSSGSTFHPHNESCCAKVSIGKSAHAPGSDKFSSNFCEFNTATSAIAPFHDEENSKVPSESTVPVITEHESVAITRCNNSPDCTLLRIRKEAVSCDSSPLNGQSVESCHSSKYSSICSPEHAADKEYVEVRSNPQISMLTKEEKVARIRRIDLKASTLVNPKLGTEFWNETKDIFDDYCAQLEGVVIRQFLNSEYGKPFDKYLFIMVFVYYVRAKIQHPSMLDFFACLYLAVDMEEDISAFKDNIVDFYLGPYYAEEDMTDDPFDCDVEEGFGLRIDAINQMDEWDYEHELFIAHKDKLCEQMNWNTCVSQIICSSILLHSKLDILEVRNRTVRNDDRSVNWSSRLPQHFPDLSHPYKKPLSPLKKHSQHNVRERKTHTTQLKLVDEPHKPDTMPEESKVTRLIQPQHPSLHEDTTMFGKECTHVHALQAGISSEFVVDEHGHFVDLRLARQRSNEEHAANMKVLETNDENTQVIQDTSVETRHRRCRSHSPEMSELPIKKRRTSDSSAKADSVVVKTSSEMSSYANVLQEKMVISSAFCTESDTTGGDDVSNNDQTVPESISECNHISSIQEVPPTMVG
eukprot:CFRG5810T1